MKIAVSDPATFFGFFYIMAFATMVIAVVAVSLRHKIPLMSVLLVLATVTLFTVAGSRIACIPPECLGTIITSGSSSPWVSRSVLGGIIAGLAGLVIISRTLGTGTAVLNMYSWVVPLSFGIQQIGCFFNGCCFGKPTSLPWGVSYPFRTCAHHAHWASGLIGETDKWSLAVHPVQIYESVSLFTLAYISFTLLKKWKKKWSSLIFTVSVYLLIKFVTEFFRYTGSLPSADSIKTGSTLHLITLIIGVTGLIILAVNEKYSTHKAVNTTGTEAHSTGKAIIFTLFLSAGLYLFRGLFSWYEMVSTDIVFIPTVVLAGLALIRSLAAVTVRFAASSLMTVPLFILMLAYPQDTVKQKESVRSFYDSVKSYSVIDAGASFGSHYSVLQYNPQGGECGTYYTTEDYKYEFILGGFGYAKVKKNEKHTTSYGIRMFIGQNVETNMTYNSEKKYTLFGIYPYLKYDIPWVGFGIGLHAGNLRWIPNREVDEREMESGTKMFPLMPSFELRVGRRDIVDLKYSFASGFATPFPVLMSEVSLGSGFSLKPDYSFRYGIGIADNRGYHFISAEALPSKKLGVFVKYNFKNEIYTVDSYLSGKWLQIGINYRFDFEN